MSQFYISWLFQVGPPCGHNVSRPTTRQAARAPLRSVAYELAPCFSCCPGLRRRARTLGARRTAHLPPYAPKRVRSNKWGACHRRGPRPHHLGKLARSHSVWLVHCGSSSLAVASTTCTKLCFHHQRSHRLHAVRVSVRAHRNKGEASRLGRAAGCGRPYLVRDGLTTARQRRCRLLRNTLNAARSASEQSYKGCFRGAIFSAFLEVFSWQPSSMSSRSSPAGLNSSIEGMLKRLRPLGILQVKR